MTQFIQFKCGKKSDNLVEGKRGCLMIARDGTAFQVITTDEQLKTYQIIEVEKIGSEYRWAKAGFPLFQRIPNPDAVTVSWVWHPKRTAKVLMPDGTTFSQTESNLILPVENRILV